MLNEKNDLEIYDKFNKKKYKIYVAKNDAKIKHMINYFNYFIEFKNTKYIGIDLEFNKVSRNLRDVALIQLNLEIENDNNGVIFVLDPKILNKNQLNILIKLLTEQKIIKIIHGGESLDIPYLFNQLFESNKELIKNFLVNLYDTKYLCEYSHIINNMKGKCSIYYLYREYNIINNEQFNYLSNIENITGPIYLINIEIKKMSDKVLEYAVYDVLYLISLYKKLQINNIIPEISRNVFYFKRISNKYFDKIDNIVKKSNNYYIILNNENIKLNDVYYYIIYTINIKFILDSLSITYFKSFLELIYKYIIFVLVSKKYKIYKEKNKKVKMKDNIETKILFDEQLINFIKNIKIDINNLL
jgi:hypothetical protein